MIPRRSLFQSPEGLRVTDDWHTRTVDHIRGGARALIATTMSSGYSSFLRIRASVHPAQN